MTSGGSFDGARILVTGAGGFIGHHLTKFLAAKGFFVRGVDLKFPEFERSPADEFEILDLREKDASRHACRGIDLVFHLAANMGGVGFISSHKAVVMHDSGLIDLHALESARLAGVRRFLYTSTACVYPMHLQERPDVAGLKEEDAYPADAEDGYGWEKLFTERQCRHYREDHGLDTRIVRFHNIFGPLGTYDGGREKAPAAICRKLALAGTGRHHRGVGRRSADALVLLRRRLRRRHLAADAERLARSDQPRPGSHALGRRAGRHRRGASRRSASSSATTCRSRQGVRGRNSDNTLLARVLDWAPRVSLEDGLARTYHWIVEHLRAEGRLDG